MLSRVTWIHFPSSWQTHWEDEVRISVRPDVYELLAVNVSDIRRIRSQVPVSSLHASLKQGAVLYFKLFAYWAPNTGHRALENVIGCGCVLYALLYITQHMMTGKKSIVHVTPENLRGLPPSRARQVASRLACGPTSRGALGPYPISSMPQCAPAPTRTIKLKF
jgi:hypothetical protein